MSNNWNLTAKQWSSASRKIKRNYELDREVTDDEISAELAMIKRHFINGTMDMNLEQLFGALSTGENPIDFNKA